MSGVPILRASSKSPTPCWPTVSSDGRCMSPVAITVRKVGSRGRYGIQGFDTADLKEAKALLDEFG